MKNNMFRFSVRTYGFIVHQDFILLAFEHWFGRDIFKFPGGGMEVGESPVQSLRREIKEEINCEIENAEIVYTPEKPIISAFYENVQVIPLYFKVQLKGDTKNFPVYTVNTQLPELQHGELTFYWVPLKKASNLLSFDSDKEAWDYFMSKFLTHAF